MTEPENLVLQQLRGIRAMQDEHSVRFDQVTLTLNAILTRLTGVEQLVIMLVGLHKDTDIRMAQLEARIARLEKLRE